MHLPKNMTTSIIHRLGYQTHQTNTSPTIHQVYLPLYLQSTPTISKKKKKNTKSTTINKGEHLIHRRLRIQAKEN